jgi:hypothetical protein
LLITNFPTGSTGQTFFF